MKQLLTALVAVFLWANGASAQCVTMPEIEKSFQKKKGSWQFVELKGLKAQAYLQRMNADPPQTKVVADSILIVTKDGAPNAEIFFFQKGCEKFPVVIDRKVAESYFGIEI